MTIDYVTTPARDIKPGDTLSVACGHGVLRDNHGPLGQPNITLGIEPDGHTHS